MIKSSKWEGSSPNHDWASSQIFRTQDLTTTKQLVDVLNLINFIKCEVFVRVSANWKYRRCFLH